MSSKSHWEKIYKEKSPHEVSWTQEIPSTSIYFFSDFKFKKIIQLLMLVEVKVNLLII